MHPTIQAAVGGSCKVGTVKDCDLRNWDTAQQ